MNINGRETYEDEESDEEGEAMAKIISKFKEANMGRGESDEDSEEEVIEDAEVMRHGSNEDKTKLLRSIYKIDTNKVKRSCLPLIFDDDDMIARDIYLPEDEIRRENSKKDT